MKTSQPFRVFTSASFIKKRFSPLIATYVDPKVDSFVCECGFSFVDILSTIGTKLRSPIRIYPFEEIKTREFDFFINNTYNEIKDIGDFFLSAEYENSYAVNRPLGPFPCLIPSVFNPGCSEAKYPPWYRILLYRLLESVMFSEFEFIDMPISILYVTSYDDAKNKINSQTSSKIISDMRTKLLNVCPEWMKEFIVNIPVTLLIVGDGINNPINNNETFSDIKGFNYVSSLNFRSKSGNKVDDRIMQDFFSWDNNIINNPKFIDNDCFTSADISAVEKFYADIYKNFIFVEINRLQKFYEGESERLNKLSKTIQSWLFKKGEPEEMTKYLNIPMKKITYLQHAAYSLMTGNYPMAQRSYRYFVSSFYPDDFPLLQNRVNINNMICNLTVQGGYFQFIEDVTEMIENPPRNECLRMSLLVPLLAIEFSSYQKDWETATKFCNVAIQKVGLLYCDVKNFKNTLVGIIFERLAGLEVRQKHQTVYRTMAAFAYRDGHQKGHAFRIFLWLLDQLPKTVWDRLWQTVALEKVIILCEQSQNSRSLRDCTNLLSISNMSSDLQNILLAQFLTIFIDKTIDFKSLLFELKPLICVRKVKMFDPSQPEFYGFVKSDFKKMIDHYDRWFVANITRSSSVSFEEIWDGNGGSNDEDEERRIVPIGIELVIELVLQNIHAFTIQLNNSTLEVKYENPTPEESKSDDHSLTTSVDMIDVLSSNQLKTKIAFNVTPNLQGKYIIDKMLSNYWGYVDSVIDFRQISFIARQDFPRISLSVLDLPEKVTANQCLTFSVSIDNRGANLLTEFRIICDPFLIVEDCKSKFYKHVQIVTVDEPLYPMDSSMVAFILHVPDEESVDIHMFIDVKGIKVAFQKVHLNIERQEKIYVEKLAKDNETIVHILKCYFPSALGKFVSIIQKNGTYLRVLHSDATKDCQIFAYLREESGHIEETWRCQLLKNNELGFLYEIEDNEYLAQANVKIPPLLSGIGGGNGIETAGGIYQDDLHFKLSVHEDTCKVKLLDYEGKKIYIEPLPIKMETTVSNVINCCSWVGKSRQLIGKGIVANFRFVQNIEGIAKIDGFRISEKRDFSSSKIINISQTFEMKMK